MRVWCPDMAVERKPFGSAETTVLSQLKNLNLREKKILNQTLPPFLHLNSNSDNLFKNETTGRVAFAKLTHNLMCVCYLMSRPDLFFSLTLPESRISHRVHSNDATVAHRQVWPAAAGCLTSQFTVLTTIRNVAKCPRQSSRLGGRQAGSALDHCGQSCHLPFVCRQPPHAIHIDLESPVLISSVVPQ